MPAYGEYASPEHAAQAQAQRPQAPQQGAPQAYNQQPGQQYPPQGYYATPQQWQGQRPIRTGDMVASTILLVVGLLVTLLVVLTAFSIPLQMDSVYQQYGVSGSYTPGAGEGIAAAVLIISHVVLLALATLFTVILIRRRKVSFWLPLSAGVLAAVIYFVTFVVLIVADPSLYQALLDSSRP